MSKYIKNPFAVVILLIVSVLIVSVVKHQKVSLNKQVIRVEVLNKNIADNFSQQDGVKPIYWLVENLEIGSSELNPQGRVVAEIIDIDYSRRFSGADQVFLTVELEVVGSVSSGKTVYKGQSIEVGESIELHFNDSLIVGQIIDANYDPAKIESEELVVTGVYRNIPVDAAAKVEPGMTVTNPFTDEIYAVIESARTFYSSDNLFYKVRYDSVIRFRTDHSLRNLEISVRLVADKHLDQYYFLDYQVIKVGGELYLPFSDLELGLMEVTNVAKVGEN